MYSREKQFADGQKCKVTAKTDASTNGKRLMQAGSAICCIQKKIRNKSKGHNDNQLPLCPTRVCLQGCTEEKLLCFRCFVGIQPLNNLV